MFRQRQDDIAAMYGMSEDLRRGPFRARRGMIEPAILELLLERPMHGYEIISQLEERSHGMWRPSAGSVYPTLQLLEEKDLVIAKSESGKKVYSLTDLGKEGGEKAKQQKENLRTFWKDKKEESVHLREVRNEVHEIFTIMKQFRKQTSPEKVDRLLEMLRGFKHSLIELVEE